MGYLPEVVRIIAAHVDGPGGSKAIGTGFFLAVDGVHVLEEGLLMTNAHVVTNSPVVKIMTTYIEHQALPVTVVAVCHDRDLALLKVEPQVAQFLKRSLHERYGLDHIPALSFEDSDTLRTGTQLHAVGHPLGLVDQQFTTGKYQGCVHLNGEIRGLSGALINGGNSGGPLMCSHETPGQKKIEGLHYFLPSKYRVIGINTFKLTGANVDGENGFIHSNTVKRVLSTLLSPLKSRYEREGKVMDMLKKMSVQTKNPSAAQALISHLSPQECETIIQSGIEKAWTDSRIGGMAKGKPRSFQAWLGRHVFKPNTKHMHRGGPELLSKVLSFAGTQDWDGLLEWKAKRRWNNVREMTTEISAPETRPSMIRILPPPPSHIHSPQIGITSRPIFNADLLLHYGCPRAPGGKWLAEGGVIVTDVAPKSLYKLAGGKEGDIIYKFESVENSASLSPAGTWYSGKRDLPMSLRDLCNDTPINGSIKLSLLRQGEEPVDIEFTNREPKYEELPDIRQSYAFCDEGRFEKQQRAQVQGIIFAPLRLHHVAMFNLLDYMATNKRHLFRVVVESVSPESSAYATDAVHAGSIVTKINDEPAAENWTDFQKQLSQPHQKSGCWVLDTAYNGTKSKYAVLARQIEAK
jgi:S1-C subfamily serine protease